VIERCVRRLKENRLLGRPLNRKLQKHALAWLKIAAALGNRYKEPLSSTGLFEERSVESTEL
jgi:hypothetical protein